MNQPSLLSMWTLLLPVVACHVCFIVGATVVVVVAGSVGTLLRTTFRGSE